jgi:hypothetical protein
MQLESRAASNAHDVRLDLFLGIANWFIFLNHIPNNSVNWVTIQNYGFSDATDVFIFIAGFAASMTYAGIMKERGVIVGGTRVFRRAWQLYAAYVALFAIYIVTIGDVAARYGAPDLIYQFNIGGLIEDPIRTIGYGLLLQSPVVNLDLLQLYVLLMACFPIVLWMMLRNPHLTMAGSLGLYVAARYFDWNLPSFPEGNWHFNPFCWQLLFVFGAWCAVGGVKERRSRSPILFYFAGAYLLFALAMTMAGHFPAFGQMFPGWLIDTFSPDDDTNLSLYRILHFIALMFLAMRILPRNWRGLNWPILRPVVLCGQQSLAVFCAGVLLSFAGHFILITGSGSLAIQLAVSASGIAIMTLVASYVSWSKRQDRPSPNRIFRTPSLEGPQGGTDGKRSEPARGRFAAPALAGRN